MKGRFRTLAIALYLPLCVALGGSSQRPWLNLVLQLLAIGILAWALIAPPRDDLSRGSKQLLILLALAILLVLVQLVPLPPAIWTALPGRELVERGYHALGQPLPWLPISLTPYEGISSLLSLLPAVAVFVAVVRFRPRQSWLVASLLVAALAAVMLGAMQIATGGLGQSSWYPYQVTNEGAVGFFANINHMGSLLLVSIPFGVALAASAASTTRDRAPKSGLLMFGGAALLVALAGIILNRSLAGVALVLPVLMLSALLLPSQLRVRRFAVPAAILGAVAAAVLLATSPIAAELRGADLSSFESRAEIWAPTMQLARQTFPVGTGIGSFSWVFPLAEDPAAATMTYVNHAHNDYAEILLEAGLAGLLLLAAFLAWWVVQVIAVWRSPVSSHYARAATIASGALLAHSFVDYPLRTMALSSIFALCLALMAQPRVQRAPSSPSDVRPTKHVTI